MCLIQILSFLRPIPFFPPSGLKPMVLPEVSVQVAEIPSATPPEKKNEKGLYIGKREDGKKLLLNPKNYAESGERDAILASSGMGKSYLTGVLLEEALESGCMVCVIDPEGEHYTLAERYPVLVIGGEHGKIPLETDVGQVVEQMLKNRLSAVFDLSEHVDEAQQQIYAQIMETLFQAQKHYRTKVRLVVEEAQIYAPQSMAAPSLLVSQNMAKRGRKRGIDTLWATQRPASLNKDVLSQCVRFWFGGIQAEQDYNAIKPFLNEAGISFSDVKALKPGEFYCYAKRETHLIKVRKRYCTHAGGTPAMDDLTGKPASQKDVERIASLLSAGYDEVPNPR